MWYTSAFFANSRRKCIIDSLVKGLILGLKSRAEFLSFFSPISQNLAFFFLNLSFFSWLKRFFALVAVSSIFLAAQGVEANFSWKMKAFQPLLASKTGSHFPLKSTHVHLTEKSWKPGGRRRKPARGFKSLHLRQSEQRSLCSDFLFAASGNDV